MINYAYLKQLIQAENIDEKRWPPRMLAHIIDNWKNRALRPDNIPNIEASSIQWPKEVKSCMDSISRRLKTLNAVDFGDLLLHM